MNGNVREWNDLTGTAELLLGLRGGTWNSGASDLSSSVGGTRTPSSELVTIGFRLASSVPIPEPSTCAMALAGLACGGYSVFRRRKRA
jgi:hypothetical protein